MTDIPAFSLRLKLVICPSTTLPGATVPNPSDIWFPVPDGVLTLPALPPEQTNPETIPPNSASVGECFDPDNVDISQIFTNLLPQTSTPGVYETTLDTDSLLLPLNEIIPIRGVTRLVFGLITSRYDLTPKFTDVVHTVRSTLNVYRIKYSLLGAVGAFALTGVAAGRVDLFNPIAGGFILNGQDADFVYTSTPNKVLTAGAGAYNINFAIPATVLSSFDTDIVDDTGTVLWYWNFQDKPGIVSTSKFGSGSVQYLYGEGHELSFVLNDKDAPPPGSDYTIEVWYQPLGTFGFGYPILAMAEAENNAGLAYIIHYTGYNNGGQFKLAERNISTGTTLREWTHPTTSLEETTWVHIAAEYHNGTLTVFVDGVPGISVTPLYALTLRGRTSLGLWPLNINSGVGLFDDFRLVTSAIYKGESYTPPLVAYTVSGDPAGGAGLSLRSGLTADAGSIALTGQAVTLKLATYAFGDTGAFSLQGADIAVIRGSRVVSAAAGSVALAGGVVYDYPTYITTNAANSTTGNMFLTIAGTPLLGDLHVLFVETSSGSDNSTFGPAWQPSGWNAIPGLPLKSTGAGTSGSWLAGFWRVVDDLATDLSTIFIRATANHAHARVLTFRGANPNNPIISASTKVVSTPSTAMVFPELTTTGYRNLVLDVAAFDFDSSSVFISGYNTNSTAKVYSTFSAGSTSSGDGGGVYVAINNVKQPSVLPAATATNANNNQYVYISLEIGSQAG